jgi:hypothetical protein
MYSSVIDSLGCTRVSNLMFVKKRVLKIMSGQYHIPISSLTFRLFYLKITSCHLLIGYTSVTSLMSIQQKSLLRYCMVSISIWPDSPLTFDLLTSKSIGVIDSLGCISVSSLSSKRFSRYWVVSIFVCPVWPLTFGFKIYSSWCTSVQSKQRVLKILRCQYIHVQFDPWPLTLWPQNQ